jgi:uncharacterized protein YndB with AHSA1/START domain
MSTIDETAVATQVYRVYIKATPQAIWDAITSPEWTQRYGYRGLADYDLRPGGRARSLWSEELQAAHGLPEVAVDGEVLEADPPRKLVQTFCFVMDAELAAEGYTRLTWEIEERAAGVSALTVTHELEGARGHAAVVSGALEETGAGGGWSMVLSDLKSLLETGEALGLLR